MYTPDEELDLVRATLERMREARWVDRYAVRSRTDLEIVWTDNGLARLGMLREFSRQLNLTDGEGIAMTACFLAEKLGPEIRR